jgi:tRNA pseudouridine55 synthase
MKKILNLYKKVGWTPLETIEKFKLKNPVYKNKRMGYAGRLDPMAEGVLLILVDEENKKIGQYMGFDKEYAAEFILGFSSDSNDVLGIAENGKIDNEIDEKELKKKIKGFVGKYEQKIPKYSSYKIKGKPMFHYARKGIEVEDVKKNVIIKKVKVNSIYQISNGRLLKYIVSKINKVKGDFRQRDIVNNWNKLLKEDKKYHVLNVTLSVSSGTYIRAIADDFGRQMEMGGLLLSLKRTKVGKFGIRESLRI